MNREYRIRMKMASVVLTLVAVLVPTIFASQPAHARTLKVLYTFTGNTDGAAPFGVLIFDGAGNLYGTTAAGGASGYGTVFKLDTAGNETVLHSFGYSDGAHPIAGLIRDTEGNLYGVTAGGGRSSCQNGWWGFGHVNFFDGCGMVFRLDTTGNEAALYTFTGAADGMNPVGSLVQDAAGTLYGTASLGGDFTVCSYVGWGCGVVFKLDTTGTYTVLHTFEQSDGGEPQGRLILGEYGTLYGTNAYYGYGVGGCGVAFKLDTTGTETVLHTFGQNGDVCNPYAGLVAGGSGTLYGSGCSGGAHGRGAVFKIDSTGTESLLHSFMGKDGACPTGDLVQDLSGNLYGTTYGGGGAHKKVGTVFKVNKAGKITVLYRFLGKADGGNPYAGLFMDGQGNLYGTAAGGGAHGAGVVFKITP